MNSKLKEIRRVIEKQVGHPLDLNSRKRDVILARALYYRVARDFFNGDSRFSLSAIGKELGKDHATVLHSLRKVGDYVMIDDHYRAIYDMAMNTIKRTSVEDESKDVARSGYVKKFMRLKKKNSDLVLENERLQRLLDEASKSSDRFTKMTKHLDEDQLEQIYEKVDLMVRVMNA